MFDTSKHLLPHYFCPGFHVRLRRRFLGKYCEASQIPKQIVARGNGMYVTFTSDSSGNDVGFGATYTSRPASADPVTTATTTTTGEFVVIAVVKVLKGKLVI